MWAQPPTQAEKAAIEAERTASENAGRQIPSGLDKPKAEVTRRTSDPPSRPALPVVGEPGGVAGPAPAMTGTFDSDFGTLFLTKTGGTYLYKDGRVTITKIYGNFMDGKWSQSESSHRCPDGTYHGTFHFRFTPGGFTGEFRYCDGEAKAGAWNGKRR